ncbi:MAG: hypothetical protein V2I37_00515 [Marinilabiliaceae bacterium]|jgi:hypothetical protein|nr:hypothetical protein [Marinilabiliaceae bacterium]
MEAISLEHRIRAFSELGKLLQEELRIPGSDLFSKVLVQARAQNSWFTAESVIKSIDAIAKLLDSEILRLWLSAYKIPAFNNSPLRIGVIMAGNIPMVGFHDFLCILISGNAVSAKLSSKDSVLLKYLAAKLIDIEPRFAALIEFKDSLPSNTEALIATGSDNSARYFDYHYGHLPHIFRKNRNSVALIHRGISESELEDLGSDIFDYFGLGCRSVSMVYIPEEFSLYQLVAPWKKFSHAMDNDAYRLNYNYHRALYTTGGEEFYDAGHIILKESAVFNSPVSVLHYRRYSRAETATRELELNSEKIQVLIGKGYHKFGSAQSPQLPDYADNVDTIEFLLSLSS